MGVRALFVIVLAITGLQHATSQAVPRLLIMPSVPHQKVAVHKSAVLTCQPDVPNIESVSDLQWRDPRGRVVPNAPPGPRPELYTEALPGKQSLLLYITSITPSMAGNYTCHASYANSELLTAFVRLDTYVAITWVNAPEKQHATAGRQIKVMCEVTAEPSPNVDWFKDGVPITNDERHVIHRNGLQISKVTESDDGTYVCRAVVIDTGELAERNIKLEVDVVPEIVPPPNSTIKIRKGESAQIKCTATGKPKPTYTWVQDSTKMDLKLPGTRFSVVEQDGTLRINQVEAGDYGTYTCQALNSAGVAELAYKIDVIVPPVIERIENVTAAERREDARLVCRATGRPAPQVAWRKLSRAAPFVMGSQPNDSRITVESQSTLEGDQYRTTGVISVARLNRTDDGLYECIATNEAGEARLNGHIQVKFAPTFANMPREPVWSWGGRPANLTCLAESIPNATIKWRWQGRELIESHHVKIFGSSAFSYVTVTPTDDSQFGEYSCIATNSEGEAQFRQQLLRAFPPGPVQQVKQDALTATSVRFAIEAPAELMGPRVLAIVAQYKENANYDWSYARNRTWSLHSPYTVEGLTSMTTYDFRFAAVNQVGQGAWGGAITLTTLRRSAPETPAWRDAVSATSLVRSQFHDRHELRWKIPADNGEPIDGYKVTWCLVRKVNGEWADVAESACGSEELTGGAAVAYEVRPLRADSRYRITLQAHNRLGLSPPAVVYLHTAQGGTSCGDALVTSFRPIFQRALISVIFSKLCYTRCNIIKVM